MILAAVKKDRVPSAYLSSIGHADDHDYVMKKLRAHDPEFSENLERHCLQYLSFRHLASIQLVSKSERIRDAVRSMAMQSISATEIAAEIGIARTTVARMLRQMCETDAELNAIVMVSQSYRRRHSINRIKKNEHLDVCVIEDAKKRQAGDMLYQRWR